MVTNPTASALLPPLKSNQHWASQATISTKGLTKDEEDDWKAINMIKTARVALQLLNTTNPTAPSKVVATMLDNQLVLTTDSMSKDVTPTKRSPSRPTAASQLETRRAKFRILLQHTIAPPV